MTKTYFILAVTAAATAICIMLPGVTEHLGHGLHLATIVVSGKHLVDEIAHAVLPRKTPEHL